MIAQTPANTLTPAVNKVSDDIASQVIQLREYGKTMREIGTELGIGPATALRILRRNNQSV